MNNNIMNKHKFACKLQALLKKVENQKIIIRVPIMGFGCGVLGLALQKVSLDMGKYASILLRALEYRGYDSTGAAFQDDNKNVILLKDVGAPSVLVKTLEIEKQAGKLFCGQVRWATFGFVDKINAQPHVVKCKRHIYGAHNGNITNTRELKQFLSSQGHTVLSDNDGEMLVHTVEHYFDIEMDRLKNPKDFGSRKLCMRQAIILAAEKMIGSYAAVIADPVTETLWCIKAGSSLYFGIGEIEDQKFCLASSDLTAVLRFTKMLVPFREGEFIEYNGDSYQVYAQRDLHFKALKQAEEKYVAGQKIDSKPVYSKLRAEDVELLPEFAYFMEQEIYAQPESTGRLIKLFQGGSNTGRRMLGLLEKAKLKDELNTQMFRILGENNPDEKRKLFNELCESKPVSKFYDEMKESYGALFDVAVKEDFEKKYFFSEEKNIFIDLLGKAYDKKKLVIAKALDSLAEEVDVHEFNNNVNDFIKLMKNTVQNNRNAYTISCGTSFHATKIAAQFFNEIAGIEIIPILPGDFRGGYSNCIKDNDVVIGVSQSGETKDLIDIFNDIDKMNLSVRKAVLVNNMNSTLGQEKADVAIPILCGPEIAVPATKSFMNQITLFYYLAIRTAEMKIKELNQLNPDEKAQQLEQIKKRYKALNEIPMLLKETIHKTV
ncbi:MAG: SIS domain-containing protein, partial [Candidatus Cloacimonetes bacterium]|nr:SIS domain-containing protein [Candidatus Cloacimonadota bacterium]